jgi:hypothetical protein
MKTRIVLTMMLVLGVIGIPTQVSCNKSKAPEQAPEGGAAAPAEERVEKNPDRNAYFGEEHIHTSWSVDAWVFGNRITGPDDALKIRPGTDDQAPNGVRHQNRNAHGLHGCDRPLRVRRDHKRG